MTRYLYLSFWPIFLPAILALILVVQTNKKQKLDNLFPILGVTDNLYFYKINEDSFSIVWVVSKFEVGSQIF